jgi:hypothetical protein
LRRNVEGTTISLQSMQFCRINFEDTTPLLDAFSGEDSLSLQSLSIVESNFNDEQCVPLLQALTAQLDNDHSDDAALTRLSMAGNVAGEKTVRAVAEYLQHPKCQLQHLNLSRQTTPNMADLLTNKSSPFLASLCQNDSLRSLYLTDLSLEGHHVAELFGSTTHNHQNLPSTLKELNLSNNLVAGIFQLVHSDDNHKSILAQHNLQRLDLTGNPFWRHVRLSSNSGQERMALRKITNQCPHLGYLGSEVDRGAEIEVAAKPHVSIPPFWTMLQYSLDMNRAGRSLFDGKDASANASPLPLALVPLILERATIGLAKNIDHVAESPSIDEQVRMANYIRNSYQNYCTRNDEPKVSTRAVSALYGLVQGLVQTQCSGRV